MHIIIEVDLFQDGTEKEKGEKDDSDDDDDDAETSSDDYTSSDETRPKGKRKELRELLMEEKSVEK